MSGRSKAPWPLGAGLSALLALASAGGVFAGCAVDPVRRVGGLGPPEETGPGAEGANGNGGPSSGTSGSGGHGGGQGALACLADDPSDADAGAACSSTSFEPSPPPLGVYLMIDRSGSMGQALGAGPSKWEALRGALAEVLAEPSVTAMSAGAQFFPASSGGECDQSSYAETLVAIAPAGSSRGPLDAAMGSVSPSGSTPTAPALSGAIEGASKWAEGHPGGVAVAVLATDGKPTECLPVDAPSLAKIADRGAHPDQGRPAVATFVIGIVSAEDAAEGALGLLDAVAKAGGTEQALVVNPTLDVGEQAAAALREVASRGVACSFALPASIDPSSIGRVNVSLSSASCGEHRIGYVAPGASCDGDGFRYDRDPKQGLPTRLELCKLSCQRFRSGDSMRIEVGCPTKGWPSQ